VWLRLSHAGDGRPEQGQTLHCKKLVCLSAAAAAVAVSMATGLTASATAASLTGAGSTLVSPLEADWSTGWQSATGNSVSYSAVGSAAGITDVSQRLVDFGASDAPLTSAQEQACGHCVQIPWALSATAIGFHLNGVSTLRLSGKVLAGIYLGRITNWDDSRIKAVNPRVNLPNRRITVVFRSDGSGDTYAFTQFLSKVSPTWASKLGYGTTVSFPTGVGGKGNGGVAAILTNTNGAIAYVAASYLLGFGGLGAAAIENRAGNYEYPNLKNIASAAAWVRSIPANNALPIVDPPKRARIAYPISTFSYVIVPQSTSKKFLLTSWIAYALTTGQLFGARIDFPPIPSIVLGRAQSTLASLK
jgi:phosphate transport system substrate-binding protein